MKTPMTACTIKALRASIAHWRRLASGRRKKGEEPDAGSCALCHEFNRLEGCHGCPIREKTGENYCKGSPYNEAADEWDKTPDSPQFRAAASRMLAFLEGLVPEGK